MQIQIQQTKTNQTTLTHQDLCQFTGDMLRYSCPLNRNVIYTPGVRYIAEVGHAYWLIDAIASYFGSDVMKAAMQKDARIQQLQFWKLAVKDNAASLSANADSGEIPFVTQEIEFTDFPLDEIEIWAGFDGSLWTLYLPSEH